MEIEDTSNRRSSGSSFCIKRFQHPCEGKTKHFDQNMEWRGQGRCKIGLPNSDLKYSPWSGVHVGSIEYVHHSQFYSKHPTIERLRWSRCDGLDPLVQDPNQAKNMPRNSFTKPTIWSSLQVHMVGVHRHTNDMHNNASEILGRKP